MRVPIYLAGIAFLIFSCKKNDNNGIINTPLPSGVSMTFLPSNIPDPLISVFFTSAGTGFVGGGKGGIYKTIDSGKTWTALNSTVSVPIYSIYFVNAQLGFAAGGEDFCEGVGCVPPGSFVLRTLNGGATWEKVYTLIEKTVLNSVCFVNASTGFCAGGNLIIKTSDSGRTWNEYRVNDLGGKLMKIAFTDTQKGYITSHAKIVATTDGGLTWKATSTHQNPGYYAISAPGGALYVAGMNKMIKSSNEGAVWSELSNSPYDIFALHFFDDKKGFAFGRGNYSGGDFGHSYASVYFTSDGGKTWSGSADFEDAEWILAASFPTDGLGYAVSATRIIRIRVI